MKKTWTKNFGLINKLTIVHEFTYILVDSKYILNCMKN